MKKIFIILTFLASTLNVFADKLSVNDATLKNENTASLDISLDNTSTDIVGLQFNLVLPDGIVPRMDGNKVLITPSNRLRGGYLIRGSIVADGSYLFTFLSNDRTPIEGNSGKLFSITLENSSATDGSYTADISNAITTDVRGNEQSLPDASCQVIVVHCSMLTYKVDGAIYKEYSLNHGATITPEAEPAKEGYSFSGWSEIPEIMPANDVVVNGHFTVNKYKVTFISDGSIVKKTTQDYGTAIVVPADPTKEGHSFSGWSPAVDAMVPAHDVTYTAQFSVNQYSITFDTDGGSAVAPINQDYGTVINKPTDPIKEGYTFVGWNPAVPEVMPAKDVTLKALWTINSYKLTYKVDGKEYKEYTLNYGAAITPEVEPYLEGYIFSGWSEIPVTMPAHDVEVNGMFSKGSYRLIYFVDGVKYKEFSLDYGDAIILEDEPTKEGYTFSGWEGYPEDLVMPAHDVIITGRFEKVDGLNGIRGDNASEHAYRVNGLRSRNLEKGKVYIIRGKKVYIKRD